MFSVFMEQWIDIHRKTTILSIYIYFKEIGEAKNIHFNK